MSAEQRLRETLDTFAARVREDLDARAQNLAAELTHAVQEADGVVRAESERLLAAERQQLEARLTDERAALSELKTNLEQTLAEERQALEERVQHAALGLQAEARRDQVAMLGRLLEAMRRLDVATSLSGILESLAQCALSETSRVVIFVVSGDTLKSWGHFGFPSGQAAVDVRADAVKVLTAALTTQRASVIRPVNGEDDSSLPPFMRPPPGHAGLVAPLVVGGDVVAVLYAVGLEPGSEEPQPGKHVTWTDEVELMARHARARLESVTSERTVMALTRRS